MALTPEQKDSLDGKGVHWRRLHYVEAAEALDGFANRALLVDTREPEAFEAWRFNGSVNRRGKEAHLTLPRGQRIYTFCT